MHSETIPNVNNPAVKGPWGPWATQGFTLVIIAAMIVVQLLTFILYIAYRTAAGQTIDIQAIVTNGTFLSITMLLNALICTGLAILFAWLRKGPSIKDYFAIVPIGTRKHLLYLAIGLVFIMLTGLANHLLEVPIPDFILAAYTSTQFKLLLWFTICIVVPVYEELVFRGFALAGLQNTRLGWVGAVVLVSLLWTSLHFQYDLFLMAQVFLFGLVIGVVRVRSGSILPAIGLHILINTISMTETAFYLGLQNGP